MPHIEIAAEKLAEILGFPITNALLSSWLAVGILGAAALLLRGRILLVPRTLQNIMEFFMESFLTLMEGVLGQRDRAEKYFPIVGTVFLFILTSNWLGILPGVGSIGFFEETAGHGTRFVPLLRSAASDLNVTLTLATITVLAVHILAVGAIGMRPHVSRFFSLKGPMEFFVGILEFVSEFAKIISFSFRLFGNIFAGEVLLIITGFLVPIGAPIPFLMLEIFVGFVQALVFAMLTVVFISIAVAHH